MHTLAIWIGDLAIGCLLIGGVCMVAGYGVLIRRALRNPGRLQNVKAILMTKDYRLLHMTGGNLIYSGAGFTALAFLSFFVAVLLFR